MNCKKCGSPLNLDSKFCNMCGAKVESNIEGENNTVLKTEEVTPTPVASVETKPSSTSEEVKPIQNQEVVENQNNEQTYMGTKEVVNNPEQPANNPESAIETSDKNVAEPVKPPIDENSTPVVESQNVADNNVSTIQTPVFNSQMMAQNNQPGVNNSVPNNPVTNNMNNSGQSKKKTPVGLIVGIGVGVFIIGLVFILILTGGIKFNASIKSGGTTKQIIGNKSTTTSKSTISTPTTSRMTTSSTPNSNNNSNTPINAFDAILKLYTGDKPTEKNYQQVVSLIGEGVKDESSSLSKYIWKQDDNTKLSITFYSSGNQYIMNAEIEYDKRDDLKNPNVNLAGAQTISKNINNKVPVYYNDIKTSFGNEGRLYAFGNNSYKYVWVSENGGYVEARFDKDTNQCLSFFGRV